MRKPAPLYSKEWRDENLLIVYAVEGFAHIHNMTPQETLKLFREYGVTQAIRRCYGALHTQDMDEAVYFAEDYIRSRGGNFPDIIPDAPPRPAVPTPAKD
jgi:hypothetical protein